MITTGWSVAAAAAAVTLIAGIGAAVADAAGKPGRGPLKMLAASGYLAFAWSQGALESPYGRVVFLALGLSWAGDFLLLGDGRRAFVAGLVAFLLAHLAFAAAFTLHGVTAPVAAGAGVAMLAVDAMVLRWLLAADLPAPMRAPLTAYLVAIALMVALAAGTGSAGVAAGAIAFAASDIFVARQRFVRRSAMNRLIGLPLYFAGQLLLAASVGGPGA